MSNRHSRSPSPAHESRKRGRIACITCRQAKVRCDLTTPPCSRCSRMQLDCSIDPGFKRTNKRDKFNELEDNLQRLKSIVEKQSIDAPNRIPHASTANDTLGEVNGSGSPFPGNQLSHSISNPLSEDSTLRSLNDIASNTSREVYSLGEVSLSPSEADRLFGIYFDKYHPILPILDSSKSYTEYHEAAPMLFWAIIATALRTYQPDATLLSRLTPILSIAFWGDIGSSVKSIGGPTGGDITEIQSLVLLATWPLLNLHLWSDRSMTMGGMALTGGMHIGLHRPGFDAEYSREPPKLDDKLITSRSSAWVAAYCLCVTVAIENGHEALVPSKDWLINNVCSPAPTVYVPDELRYCAIIMKHANDAFKIFASMTDNPAAIPHEPSFFTRVAVFEKTISEIDDLYSAEMSLANKLRSQGSLLLMQSMYFLSDQSLEQSRFGALRAYATATNVITLLVGDDNANAFLVHAPNVFLRIIVRACFVIMRTLFSTHGNTLDRINGRTIFNTGVFSVRQMSVKSKEKDQAIRVAEALKMMWKHMEGEPAFLKHPPLLRIRSRLGATLLYDCLLYYRHAAIAAQNQGTALSRNDSPKTAMTTPVHPTAGPSGQIPYYVIGGEGWSTPSFESFLDSDLSWMDSLIDPVQMSEAT